MRRAYKPVRDGLTCLQWPFIAHREAPCRLQWRWWAWVMGWGVLGLALAVWAG